MSVSSLLLGLLVGLLVGAGIGWLVRDSMTRHARREVDDAEGRFTAKVKEELATAEDRLSGLVKGGIEESSREGDAAALRAIEDMKERLGLAVKSDVAQSMQENSQVLVSMANENFRKSMADAKAELDRKHQLFDELVRPLATGYEKLNPQVEHLRVQVQTVSAETAKLSSALTNSRQVGNWGEVQLRRVIELAGMAKYCDFIEQVGVGPNNDRPDVVIKLPNNRAVAIDAKASTKAFLESRTASDEGAAKDAMRRHANMMRKQVHDLAKKDYGRLVPNAIGFTVMFVPGDQFLSAALDVIPNIVVEGMEKRIAIATPASLIALLWTVAHGWQQVEVAQSAKQIQAWGRDLYESVAQFASERDLVGRALEAAVKAHNKSVDVFVDRIEPKGERFAGVTIGEAEIKPLTIDQVEKKPRLSASGQSPNPGSL